MTTPLECDCLNHCGDDPWLKDGRAQPCANLLAEQIRDKQEKERAEKVVAIADIYGTNNIVDLIVMMHSRIQRLEAGGKS